MFVSKDQKDWDEYIPLILFAYRTSICETTGDSPFYLLFAQEPRLHIDTKLLQSRDESTSISEHRKKIVEKLEVAHKLAKENIERAQQTMKNYYDKKAKDANFELGDRVWVYTPKTAKGLSKKLLHNWHGPYRIVKKLSPVHFYLRAKNNKKVNFTVHANRMKHYVDPNKRPIRPDVYDNNDDSYLCEEDIPEDSFENNDSVDKIIPIDNKTIFEVEKILETRKRNGKNEFKIRWKGFSRSSDSWEPQENINEQLVQFLSKSTQKQ